MSGASSSLGGIGTPAYRAPELWRGKPPASPATDVYSLGCILFEMLTGKVLFDGETPDEILTQHLIDGAKFTKEMESVVPPQTQVLILKVLNKEMNKRPENAQQFHAELLESQKLSRGRISEAFVGKPDSNPVEVFSQKTAAKAESDLLKVELAPGIDMEFVRVPAGEFLMGSTDDDKDAEVVEKPQHKVYLDEYWIGKYPVTNRQYQVYIKATTARPPTGWDGSRPPVGKEHHPVAYVSWEDARDFCEWLSEKGGARVRLPSEAEWEKAARGTRGRIYPWGDQKPDDKRCNFTGNIGNTTPVGKYSPAGDSAYGCADMAGNVWEWMADWYEGNFYRESPRSNPGGPESGVYKVLRGGSWNNNVGNFRSADRNRDNPTNSNYNDGFRCACSL